MRSAHLCRSLPVVGPMEKVPVRSAAPLGQAVFCQHHCVGLGATYADAKLVWRDVCGPSADVLEAFRLVAGPVGNLTHLVVAVKVVEASSTATEFRRAAEQATGAAVLARALCRV